MDCKLVPYGEEERRCVKCGYITWNNEKTDKEIIDDMIAAGYPVPNCRENTTKCECGANTSCQCGPEEPKQETLEEVRKVYWVGVVKWNDGTFYTTEPFYEYDEGIKIWSAEFSSKHQGEFEYIDYERFDGVVRDLEYWKNNAEEDYITTPISVLRYISELEKKVEQDKKRYSEEEVLELLYNCRGENPIQIDGWFEQNKKK